LFLVAARIIFGYAELSDNISDWLFAFFVQIIGMGLMPLLLYKFWVKGDPVKDFRINVKINPYIYLVAIAIGIALHFLITSVSVIWQNVIILMGFTPINSASTIYSGAEVLIFEIIASALLPGICEEITYRGLALRMLDGIKDEKAEIIIVALLFGLGHQFIMQTGYAFAAGLVFAYLAIKTRSIVPGMIIHFLNNFLSVISDYSEQKGGGYHAFESTVNAYLFSSWGTIIITLAAAIVATVLLLKLAKKLAGEQPVAREEETETTFFYPNSTQYIDDLFGKSLRGGTKVKQGGTAWYEYACLYAAIAIMTAVTAFTFMWGVWR
jgi:membrane protease YdiL (CAAX protease family)